jgi:hypothetical protein
LPREHLVSSELNRRRKVNAGGVDQLSAHSGLQEKTIRSVRQETALAGLTRKHLLAISCECCSCWEYFAAGAWYVFVRIGFCWVFNHSTKELHDGEEGKEKESKEEEVILSLGVVALGATPEIGGWTHPAALCFRDMHFERRSWKAYSPLNQTAIPRATGPRPLTAWSVTKRGAAICSLSGEKRT